jgi:hypothetical protein
MTLHKIHSSKFAGKLANELAKQSKPFEIIAATEDELSPTELATEHAKTYWMMGWNWEEISAILEDMEFEEKVINAAIKAAQKYAHETLNDGPFNIFKDGQLICLSNGTIGQLACKYKDAIDIRHLENDEILKVSFDQIDVDKSNALKEAHALRISAHNILKEAQEEDIEVHMLPQKLTPPGPPQQPMGIKPEKLETFTVKLPQKEAPKGWGGLAPPMHELEEVSAATAALLNQIEVAESELATVQGELDEINAWAGEVRKRKKKLTNEQTEAAKQVFSLVGLEQQALDDLNITFFQKYKEKALGIQRIISEKPQAPGPWDEIVALREILTTNAPEIAEKVFATLDEWKRANTRIDDKIEETFALYPHKGHTAQVLEKMTGWIGKLWKSIKTSIDELYSSVFPKIDETMDAMDAFMAASGSAATASQITRALQARGLVRKEVKVSAKKVLGQKAFSRKRGTYELSFAPEFFGDIYTRHSPEGGPATNVADAIVDFFTDEPAHFMEMLEDLFPDWADVMNMEKPYLSEGLTGDIMDMIRRTNTVGTLTPPVDVWIDPEGYYRVDVYDEPMEDLEAAYDVF